MDVAWLGPSSDALLSHQRMLWVELSLSVSDHMLSNLRAKNTPESISFRPCSHLRVFASQRNEELEEMDG